MSKTAIAAPIDPATEVTREDIAELAKCSLCKVGFITTRNKWGFPKPVRLGPKGKVLYSRAAVLAWLAVNDLKSMVFVAEDRAPLKGLKKATGIDSAAVAQLPIGIKPTQFKSTGKTKTVHLEEVDVYAQLNPHITRFSNNCEHRLSAGVRAE